MKKLLNIKFSSFLFCILCFVFSVSCTNEQKTSGTGKLKIVCTTGMIADAVDNITKGEVEVIALMGPGVDPHLYKATQGDLQRLQEADIIFYNGLHLEGKMGELFQKLESRKKVVAVSKDMNTAGLRKPAGFDGNYDPHIWFDVKLWETAVKTIGNTLQETDSIHAHLFAKNTDIYITRLDSLDSWVRTEIASIPEDQRVLITAHDAFGYFGEAYKIEVKGLQGISTVSDFGLHDVSTLVNMICDRKIKAIFIETSVSEKSINAVVEGCKSKGHQVLIGGSLYSDAMGEKGKPEGNYIGMVRSNVGKIVQALK